MASVKKIARKQSEANPDGYVWTIQLSPLESERYGLFPQGAGKRTSRLTFKADQKSKATYLCEDKEMLAEKLKKYRYDFKEDAFADLTMSECFDGWLHSPGTKIADSTRYIHASCWRLHIKEKLGSRQMRTLTQKELEDFLSAIHLGRSRVKSIRQTINYCFDHYSRENNLHSTVMDRVVVSYNKPDSDPYDAWTPEQVRQFLERCSPTPAKQSFYYTFFLLGFLTGARQGELLALEWEDVHFDEKYVHVRQSWDARHRKLGPTKTGKNRKVWLGETAFSTLVDMRDANGLYVFEKLDKQERYSLMPIRREFKKLYKSAGLSYMPLHGMRKTCRNMAALAGVSDTLIKARLGHLERDITNSTYRTVQADESLQAAQMIEDLVFET